MSKDTPLMEYMDEYVCEPEVGAVVCGFDREINHHKITIASLYLQSGATWIVCNPDAYGMTQKGLRMPGNGAIMAPLDIALRNADGTLLCPKVMTGKPNKQIVDLIMSQHSIGEDERSKILMIGDNPETDIALGNNAGIDTCLVLSGCVSSHEQAQQYSKHSVLFKPTYIIDHVGDPIFD